jgi:uncharacterized protein
VKAALLDVNVLLAMAWPNHQHHEAAHEWFGRVAPRTWATCALTELAFVRLSANPAFTANAVNPDDAVRLLGRTRAHPGHRYWHELPDVDGLAGMRLGGHQQVTDAYLVLVAKVNGGVLATFDRGIAAWALELALLEVLPAG